MTDLFQSEPAAEPGSGTLFSRIRKRAWYDFGYMLLLIVAASSYILLRLAMNAQEYLLYGLILCIVILVGFGAGILLPALQKMEVHSHGIRVRNPLKGLDTFYTWAEITEVRSNCARILREGNQHLYLHTSAGRRIMMNQYRYENYYEMATTLIARRAAWRKSHAEKTGSAA